MAEKMLLAFGRYLKLVRERRKLSLEDVATLTKSYPEPINKGYLSRVERGLARVGFSKMVALSRAYEVPLDAFGEKLALDLEVDQLRDAPDTKGKTFGELTKAAIKFRQRGLRWHWYASVRDAVAVARELPVWPTFRDLDEQITLAGASLGGAASSLGRYRLAETEFEIALFRIGTLSPDNAPLVFQLMATVKRRTGHVDDATRLATKAVQLAQDSPNQKYLGDALDLQAVIASQLGRHEDSVQLSQQAIVALKKSGREPDCARILNNIAQAYFDLGRLKASRHAAIAADRLATRVEDDSARSRSRILLGEIELREGRQKSASDLWHEAAELARKTHDSVVLFKAEFQMFKMAISQGNKTIVHALGRRLDRMTPWISPSEPEIPEFRALYAIHRKPKQRSVAAAQHAIPVSDNPTERKDL